MDDDESEGTLCAAEVPRRSQPFSQPSSSFCFITNLLLVDVFDFQQIVVVRRRPASTRTIFSKPTPMHGAWCSALKMNSCTWCGKPAGRKLFLPARCHEPWLPDLGTCSGNLGTKVPEPVSRQNFLGRSWRHPPAF